MYTSCLFSMLLNDNIVDINNDDGVCSLTLVVNEFSESFWHPSKSFLLKIEDGALLDFWYWLNSNILVSSEGITMLQKSLFSHTFSWDSHLFSVAKEWIQIKIKNHCGF